jgi:hypothetical protein
MDPGSFEAPRSQGVSGGRAIKAFTESDAGVQANSIISSKNALVGAHNDIGAATTAFNDIQLVETVEKVVATGNLRFDAMAWQ